MASFSIQSPSSTAFLGSTRLATDARGYEQLSLRSTCAPNQAQQAQKLSNRCRSRVGRVTALLNEVSASSPTVVSETEAEVAEKEVRLPDASSFSAFMTQVADLVELVDSRDIIELQLKQTDCEVTIRKKDALQPVATPFYMAPPSSPQVLHPQPPAAPAVTSSPAPASSTPSKAPAAAKPSTPSHPPLKCPMAGTFYRSPAPGAPPFVKVGDKVQKGQVICIIEAMKLMNEIEADQSGTVVEILAEDAKPVSVDTPLFVIAP